MLKVYTSANINKSKTCKMAENWSEFIFCEIKKHIVTSEWWIIPFCLSRLVWLPYWEQYEEQNGPKESSLTLQPTQPPSETPLSPRYAQNIETWESGQTYEEKPHKKDGTTFRPLRGLRGVGFAIKDGHFTVDFRLEGHPVWREIQITDMSSIKTTNTTLLVSFLQVMASCIVQGTTLTPLPSFSTRACWFRIFLGNHIC